jgi:hypothetical protein
MDMISVKSYAALLLSLVLSLPASAAQFAFGAFGDVPYGRDEEAHFLTMIAQMNRQDLAFAVHVGDFKAAQSECSDELFLQRRESFELSHHPFFFIPGDNEWIDCRRARWAPRDPLERLAKLRELFFPKPTSLGQRPLAVERQNERYPEHMRWKVQNVVFATLNVPGPNNNAQMPEESKPRTAAVLEWMRGTFQLAQKEKLPAVVLALHANPWTGSAGYQELLDALAKSASAYQGEVLVVHGDTHRFRFDRPMVDRSSGRKLTNVRRLEVYGSPFVDWAYVTVTVEGGKASFDVVRGSDKSVER